MFYVKKNNLIIVSRHYMYIPTYFPKYNLFVRRTHYALTCIYFLPLKPFVLKGRRRKDLVSNIQDRGPKSSARFDAFLGKTLNS